MNIRGFTSWSDLAIPCCAQKVLLRNLLSGIYPDVLHILDLTLYVDAISSAFICWTDGETFFLGRSRDARLAVLYERYLHWCAEGGRVVAKRWVVY